MDLEDGGSSAGNSEGATAKEQRFLLTDSRTHNHIPGLEMRPVLRSMMLYFAHTAGRTFRVSKLTLDDPQLHPSTRHISTADIRECQNQSQGFAGRPRENQTTLKKFNGFIGMILT